MTTTSQYTVTVVLSRKTPAPPLPVHPRVSCARVARCTVCEIREVFDNAIAAAENSDSVSTADGTGVEFHSDHPSQLELERPGPLSRRLLVAATHSAEDTNDASALAAAEIPLKSRAPVTVTATMVGCRSATRTSIQLYY